MDYHSAVKWLFEQEARGIKFGLENTRELLSRLGDPQHRFRSLHVAGTNGKGSVSAMAESVLRAAGYRTALYTSPHLVDFRERIRVDGKCIGEEEMLRLAEEVRNIAEDMAAHGRHLTFFELTTAMAFTHFADVGTEMAVVEVGMGGRLDSTNVIDPVCVAIATIALEHTSFLGSTLPQIAFEKAGTIKPGVPVITLEQAPEVIDVLERRAEEMSAPMTVVGRDVGYEVLSSTLEGTEVYLEEIDAVVSVPLAGRYQASNCALACSALAEMMRRGVYIPDEAFARGLAAVRWPGRLEVVSQRPRMILDVSHTAAGARTVAAELERML
ncbi:MAG TPA: Mur ligase family protein, partial [Methanomassiliicoccaceae archaeon]|nr:Mur ligase family protein [Methanomassiliicoccaceae archaeon]